MKEPDEPPDSDPPQATETGRLTIDLDPCPDEVRELVETAARRTLASEAHATGRLDIAVVTDDDMQHHHGRWLGRESSTDVLSFDLRDRPRDGQVDGQIIVSESTARREATTHRTDWRSELVLYVVHGCLHLCGHDDRSAGDFERMHRREDEILTDLGLGPVFSAARLARTDPDREARP